MAIRQSLWAGVVAVTTTTMVATTVTPPPLSERERHVVAGTAVQLSAAQTEMSFAPTILTDPEKLSAGLRLVGAVSAPTAAERAAALSGADVPQETTAAAELFGEGSLTRELLRLYLSGGPSAVVAYVSLALSDAVFGEDSIPSQVLGEFFDGGPQAVVAYATLALSDAIFGEDSIPSQVLGEFFDGGPQAVVAYATLAVTDAVFGEDSFASGLVTSWFYGYPFDDEDAQGAYAGVVHYVIDTIIGLAEQTETPADEDSDVEAPSDTTTDEETPSDEAPPADVAGPGETEEDSPAAGLLERRGVGITMVTEESAEVQAPEVQSDAGLDAPGDDTAGARVDSAEVGADGSDGGAETIDDITQPDDEESGADDAADDDAAGDEDPVDDDVAADTETSPKKSDGDADKKESAESTKTTKDSDDKGSDSSDGGDSE